MTLPVVVTDPNSLFYRNSDYAAAYSAVYDTEGGSLAGMRASGNRAATRAALVQALGEATARYNNAYAYWRARVEQWNADALPLQEPIGERGGDLSVEQSTQICLRSPRVIGIVARRDALTAKLAAFDAP